MVRERRVAAVFGLILMGAAACTGGNDRATPLLPEVRGAILSASNGQPVSGATVLVGTSSTETDSDGHFRVRNVNTNSSLSIKACGYESSSVPPKRNLEVSLVPEIHRGTIISNLTARGLRADLMMNGEKIGQTDRNGNFELTAPCAEDKLGVYADGYGRANFTVEEEPTEIVLEATPATSLMQQIEWESKGMHARSWRLVHPDAHSYISEEAWTSFLREEALAGYQNISVDVHDVQMIHWTFPACPAADFGPKIYRRTAALRVTLHQATPRGGEDALPGLFHLVRTKDGIWGFFPIAGCDFTP